MVTKRSALKNPLLLSAFAATLVLAADTFEPNDQPYGSQAPVALSTNDVGDGTAVAYVPWFDSATYGGELLAAPVSDTGVVNHSAPLWRASATLALQNWSNRRIATFNTETKQPVAYRWGTIGKDERAALVSEDILKYIRGDQSLEGAGGLRERSSLLGTIMHSNPVYVGKPKRGYTFGGYLAYAATHKNRPGRVYVGANDGMLHSFDAATGNEEFAYIPSMVSPYIVQLAQTPFSHRYYVDGPLVAEDAQFGGAWHTVLVASLGAGGKGLFALDVTSATVSGEADVASRLLWEFSDDDYDQLGYTYARPSIVRMNNDRWAAVVGNGYMSKDGKAALLVIDIETGSLLTKIEVEDKEDNGLSSPAVIDVDGDFRADVAYAGDLNGNLWKFDLSSANPSDWATAWDKLPLLETEYDPGISQRQPITTAPTVGLHPEGGYFVYVATGRMLDVNDAVGDNALSPQSVYGIWDNALTEPDLPLQTTDLLQQSLRVKTHPADFATVRTATANIPDWTVHHGWATRLDAGGVAPGTRVITEHALRDGRVQFTATDPATGSGDSYLMQLNAYTGGAPTKSVIDVNRDGQIDVSDNVDGDGNASVEDTAEDRVVAQYAGFGVASQPVLASIGADDAAIVNQIYTVLAAGKPATDPPAGDGEDAGLAGGHIDLDTSTAIYEFDGGSTNNHVHQWDDKHNTTVVNFFDMFDVGFDTIDEPGQPPKQGNKIFLITLANAHLSPGAIIEINGAGTPVRDYRAKMKRYIQGNLGPAESFPMYKLGAPTEAEAAAGIVQLTSFKITFAKDTITKGGVHPTATGCVKGNEPGQANEYRNGALTVQAVDAANNKAIYIYNDALSAWEEDSHAFHDQGYAVSRVGTDDGSLFWEATIFWHWSGGCYTVDKEADYDSAWQEEIGFADDRGTDADISGDPPPPPPPPDEDGDGGDGDGDPLPALPQYDVTTTRIKGQNFGRLSWRELMLDD